MCGGDWEVDRRSERALCRARHQPLGMAALGMRELSLLAAFALQRADINTILAMYHACPRTDPWKLKPTTYSCKL